MSFQWLTMRIGEEKDRRAREQQILGLLPAAVDDLEAHLSACVSAFNNALGEGGARIQRSTDGLAVVAGANRVDIVTDPELPGFQVRRDDWSMAVRIGVLPGDRLFYLDVAADQYLSMEELTRRILDRVLFPKLKD